MKKQKNYQKPEVLSEITVCEPVETGCCLRSCGGSPYHMGKEDLLSAEMKAKFENVVDQKK